MPRDRVLQVRVTDEEMALLDSARGVASRADYIRAWITTHRDKERHETSQPSRADGRGAHRHRPAGDITRTRVRGQLVETYTCACGEQVSR